jgi:PAS domain S-box-containing protein
MSIIDAIRDPMSLEDVRLKTGSVPEPRLNKRSWLLAYGAAVIATALAILIRLALNPLIGGEAMRFTMFFPAVLVSAWYGGFRGGMLSIVLSALAADYYFLSSSKSFLIPDADDLATLSIFVVVGFGISLLSHSKRRALDRAHEEAWLRKEAEEAERTQRRRFEITLASIGDAVIATDANGHVNFMNKIAESLTGWSEKDAQGRPLEKIFCIINEHTREFEENPALRAMREGAVVGLVNHTVLVAKDGSERPIDDAGSPIRDADGKTLGAVLIFRDVTQRRRLEEEREIAARTAEEANRTKDEFLAMLSHELRNPLSAILGWTVFLKSGKMPLENTAHALEIIERNTRMEVQLVESLLDISRIAAGKLNLELERVDLLGLVQAVVDSSQPVAQAKGLTLDVALSSAPLIVVGDPGRLQQIFSNLITNAIKFTSPGGHVRVRLTRFGTHAEIQVSDDGEGIDSDFLPQMFDRFRQAESSQNRSHGGLGLGLAIVSQLVHAHGGNIVAESAGKGQGSTFTVTLPIPAVIPADIEVAALHSAEANQPSVSGLHILVVDNDADARELVALTLQSGGAFTRLASSAAEALACIERQQPDVMIADIGMPDEDGYVLIQKLRAHEREHSQKHLSAIALTGYASAADRDQTLTAGYDVHLAKPVGATQLADAVAKLRNK